LLTELLQTYFFEWCNCFFKNLTNSTTVRQSTIKIMAEALIFENEKGIVFFYRKVKSFLH
jgi:hypothetical protein